MKLQDLLNDTNHIVNDLFLACDITLSQDQTQIEQINDTFDINKGNKQHNEHVVLTYNTEYDL